MEPHRASVAAPQLVEVPLSDLPKWSPWPARLLGLEPWVSKPRTLEKIEVEYDADKYARCLTYYHSQCRSDVTPEEISIFESGGLAEEPVCISIGSSLMQLPRVEARRRYYLQLSETLEPALRQAAFVVELGCGYGHNLWMLKQRWGNKAYFGGDYSKNAVRLAAHLFANEPNIEVRRFNFYDASYSLLAQIPADAPLLVFTCHAIEQLPTAARVIDALLGTRPGPLRVIHFEPAHELHDTSLLGLFRRRYAEVNDYNIDLVSVLRKRSAIRMLNIVPDVIGLNPLNPTSIIEWERSGS